jgi:hypothetical protein
MPPIDEFERLATYAHKRGYRPWLAAAIAVLGCVPAVLVTIVRSPGFEGVPLIGALFILVPTMLLTAWTYVDEEGRAARELVMWLRVIRRAITDDDADVPLNELPGVPPADVLGDLPMRETARDYREVLAPLVTSPGLLKIRIGVRRFWYVIVWAVSSAVLVIGFVLSAPR